MKKVFSKCFAAAAALLVVAGCASNPENANQSAAQVAQLQIQPTPEMKKMNVFVTVKDIRPTNVQRRYGSSNIERPELYFNNTIDLARYTVDYINSARLFKKAAYVKSKNCYTLLLTWRSAHLNLNGWIPFVIRFQNHMTVDMSLLSPSGKVLWTYTVDGHVVNTPSSFRVFSTHRCDLFQQKVLNAYYPHAFSDMCMKLSSK